MQPPSLQNSESAHLESVVSSVGLHSLKTTDFQQLQSMDGISDKTAFQNISEKIEQSGKLVERRVRLRDSIPARTGKDCRCRIRKERKDAFDANISCIALDRPPRPHTACDYSTRRPYALTALPGRPSSVANLRVPSHTGLPRSSNHFEQGSFEAPLNKDVRHVSLLLRTETVARRR